ncbi:MAG: hypothetical protein A2014_06625 [Spirochaetes bacterium GWF1_49_6]|nr:MAG: hypothetical protein A2014_06625 [Spirochaetes bacterium GWF1_49_6]
MDGAGVKRGIFVSFPIDIEKQDSVKHLSLTFDVKNIEKKHVLLYYLTFSLNAKHTSDGIFVIKARRNPVSLSKITGDLRRILDPDEDTLVIHIEPPEAARGE